MDKKFVLLAVVSVLAGCVTGQYRETEDAGMVMGVRATANPWLPSGDADQDQDEAVDAEESIPEASPVDGSDGDNPGTDADEGCPGGRVHAVTGECVECSETWHCVSLPVCDVARGVCVDFVASQCAPCRIDAPGTCGEGLECVARGEAGPAETVCVATCEAGCPRGTTCDGSHCWPAVSCTGWFANSRGSLCSDDGDCIPLGTAPGLEGCAGSCYVACESDDDCSPGTSCGEDTGRCR